MSETNSPRDSITRHRDIDQSPRADDDPNEMTSTRPRSLSASRSPPRRTYDEKKDHDNDNENDTIENQGTTLYIANLSYRITADDLTENFKSFGKIEKVQLITEPMTNESRGFGFVTFEDKRDAENAVAEMNNAEMGGRSIRVEFAKRAVGRPKTPGRYLGPGGGSRFPRGGGRERSGNQYRESGRGGFGGDRNNGRSRSRSRGRHDRSGGGRQSYNSYNNDHSNRYDGNSGGRYDRFNDRRDNRNAGRSRSRSPVRRY